MLDIKFIRENKQVVQDAIQKKSISIDLDHVLVLDDERLRLLRAIEELRSEQNLVSDRMPTVTDTSERELLISEMKQVKESMKTLEEAYTKTVEEWKHAMLHIPNIPHMDAPVGPDETYSTVTKTWGDKPVFTFEPKDHIEIMNALGLVDFERGVKVHGFRGYYLKGDAVRLCMAIWQYAIDFWSERGFNPVIPPMLVKRPALEGCGFVPQGEADIYQNQDGSYLVGTSEVGLMGMYMDEILPTAELPIKMLGFSPCYRLEVGSYSKDVKGLIRVHEFQKVEQVVLCEASHTESVAWHEKMQRSTEEFIESLGIPYQVIDAATGDMGLAKVRMYDTELWVPRENTYREISSASYFHDFQTRRLGIRYRDADGSIKFAHSLNCTAIPTPRILVSLIENFQTSDGRVALPPVLAKYMRKDLI
jgi:seryl-tRNA synthetase